MKKLILVSLHKSGTNMLTQAIGNNGRHFQIDGKVERDDLHPNLEVWNSFFRFIQNPQENFARSHLVYCSHYPKWFSDNNVKCIFLRRDLRDAVVSWSHWADGDGRDYVGWINTLGRKNFMLQNFEIPERLEHILNVAHYEYSRYSGWLYEDGVFQVSYEELLEHPLKTLAKLRNWMGEELSNRLGCTSSRVMYSRINPETCNTFRKGVSGEWKRVFTEQQKERFNLENHNLLQAYGYE